MAVPKTTIPSPNVSPEFRSRIDDAARRAKMQPSDWVARTIAREVNYSVTERDLLKNQPKGRGVSVRLRLDAFRRLEETYPDVAAKLLEEVKEQSAAEREKANGVAAREG